MQPSIHGYIIGATNALFKAKSGISDVILEIDEDRLEVNNPELRRAISLTTEDLRFIDNVIRVVSEEGRDQFMEGKSLFCLKSITFTSYKSQISTNVLRFCVLFWLTNWFVYRLIRLIVCWLVGWSVS